MVTIEKPDYTFISLPHSSIVTFKSKSNDDLVSVYANDSWYLVVNYMPENYSHMLT